MRGGTPPNRVRRAAAQNMRLRPQAVPKKQRTTPPASRSRENMRLQPQAVPKKLVLATNHLRRAAAQKKLVVGLRTVLV